MLDDGQTRLAFVVIDNCMTSREPIDDAYHEQVSQGISQAVIAAIENLRPARIGLGSFNRPELIACRRFLCEPATGLAIKSGSPHQHTFTMELANGYGGYLPTPGEHVLGGYETWPARSSFLEVDAEVKIRQRLLELLAEVKE